MKKILLLMLAAVVFIGCGKDEDEEELTQEEYLLKSQNEVYENISASIIGKWRSTEYYNDGTTSDYWGDELGWVAVKSNLIQTYEFRTDGTYTYTGYGDTVSGTYSYYKNTNLNAIAPVYVILELNDGSIYPTKRSINIYNGVMRIFSTFTLYGDIYEDSDSEVSKVRYEKK